MLKSVEGIYKDGTIELSELPSEISESPVIVTFLSVKAVKSTSQNMYFGMLSTSNQQSTEEDFTIAEFHGDSDDKLDWA